MKNSRRDKIIELVSNYEIDTQEMLAEILRESGFNVTQATVSRDVKELNLKKAPGKNGRSCYRISEDIHEKSSSKFQNILRDAVLSYRSAENIIVVKTLSGCANAVGEAIDTVPDKRILGTIAGDNTVLIVVDSKENASSIIEELKVVL